MDQERPEVPSALPTVESLIEISPNKPDATTKKDKIDPFDLNDYLKRADGKSAVQKFGTVVNPSKCVKQ